MISLFISLFLTVLKYLFYHSLENRSIWTVLECFLFIFLFINSFIVKIGIYFYNLCIEVDF